MNSYDVKIWGIYPRKNKAGKVTSYSVRWGVGRTKFFESYKSRAQADSFRASLISAQNRGEPFDTVTGRPASLGWAARDMSWFTLACEYVEKRWPDAAANTRQTIAEALIRVAPVFLKGGKGKPDDAAIRSMLRGWAFNADQRARGVPDEHREAIEWCTRNSLPISVVLDEAKQHELERAATLKLSGEKYAPTVARKTRSVLSHFLTYAVKEKALETNPLRETKWESMPKGSRTVDPRTVPNPVQARTLLHAVRQIKRSGPRLEAFFAVMYFAALRPEEVVALTIDDIDLPKKGWGEISVGKAHPYAGKHWTGTGDVRDKRGVKAREQGEHRLVPCPPELTDQLHRHVRAYKSGERGLLFEGDQGGPIPQITYTRVWRAARAVAFTPKVVSTRLARRPYSLRHAAVSTWLAAGADPAVVARWAGHSVAVLWEVYAACLHGQDVIARKQVEDFFGYQA
ncbi:tyrosine-type recombinase/integrase [Saccharopolyspora sp. NPDC049357]|uniref:tyrosine-type recombinase/integrase n=1 Tax=Saccharopolyspora sp. NPDC049357 TaxID=3154507 RepID=UPI003429A678